MAERRVGDIHVEVAGHGPALVLLHGNGEDRRVLKRQAAALAPHFTLIRPDSRAHGKSGRGDGPLTIARLADDVAEVIAALAPAGAGETPAAHVVGYSDGANVAIELALRHPAAVRSLVLISGNLDPSGLKPASLRGMRRIEGVLRFLGRFSSWARRSWEVFRLMTADPTIDAADLARIAVPTLVLVGSRDVIRPTHTRLIATSIPGARLRVIPRAGHRLIVRNAEAVNREIERFLGTA